MKNNRKNIIAALLAANTLITAGCSSIIKTEKEENNQIKYEIITLDNDHYSLKYNDEVVLEDASLEDTTEEDTTEEDTTTTEEETSTEEATTTIVAVVTGQITITSSMGSESVSQALKNAGIISDWSDFNNYLINNGYAQRIQNGTFTVNSGMSYKEIAELIS